MGYQLCLCNEISIESQKEAQRASGLGTHGGRGAMPLLPHLALYLLFHQVFLSCILL